MRLRHMDRGYPVPGGLGAAIVSLIFIIVSCGGGGNSTDEPVRFEQLYGQELFSRIQERPLAWVPLGILEDHGGHLPWGLDGLKAHKVCLHLAGKLGGIVLPANHLAGVHGDRRPDRDEVDFRRRQAAIGDFMYREELLLKFLIQTFDSLANIGFKVIVAYTGHYPEVQMRIVREAADQYNLIGHATVIPFWEPLALKEGDHGGKWETSLYLALAPEEVRMNDIREDKTGKPGWYRGQDVRSNASAELGREGLERIEAYLKEKIDGALD